MAHTRVSESPPQALLDDEDPAVALLHEDREDDHPESSPEPQPGAVLEDTPEQDPSPLPDPALDVVPAVETPLDGEGDAEHTAQAPEHEVDSERSPGHGESPPPETQAGLDGGAPSDGHGGAPDDVHDGAGEVEETMGRRGFVGADVKSPEHSVPSLAPESSWFVEARLAARCSAPVGTMFIHPGADDPTVVSVVPPADDLVEDTQTPPPRHHKFEVDACTTVQAPDDLGEGMTARVVARHVDLLLRGINSVVVAFGPAGGGRYEAMIGTPEAPGVIPSCCRELMETVCAMSDSARRETHVVSSYVALAGDKALDLCDLGSRSVYVTKEDGRGVVRGAVERIALSPDDALDALDQGLDSEKLLEAQEGYNTVFSLAARTCTGGAATLSIVTMAASNGPTGEALFDAIFNGDASPRRQREEKAGPATVEAEASSEEPEDAPEELVMRVLAPALRRGSEHAATMILCLARDGVPETEEDDIDPRTEEFQFRQRSAAESAAHAAEASVCLRGLTLRCRPQTSEDAIVAWAEDRRQAALTKPSGETALPVGWEELCTEEGVTYYVDHIDHKTQWHDPRGFVPGLELSSLRPGAVAGEAPTYDDALQAARPMSPVALAVYTPEADEPSLLIRNETIEAPGDLPPLPEELKPLVVPVAMDELEFEVDEHGNRRARLRSADADDAITANGNASVGRANPFAAFVTTPMTAMPARPLPVKDGESQEDVDELCAEYARIVRTAVRATAEVQDLKAAAAAQEAAHASVLQRKDTVIDDLKAQVAQLELEAAESKAQAKAVADAQAAANTKAQEAAAKAADTKAEDLRRSLALNETPPPPEPRPSNGAASAAKYVAPSGHVTTAEPIVVRQLRARLDTAEAHAAELTAVVDRYRSEALHRGDAALPQPAYFARGVPSSDDFATARERLLVSLLDAEAETGVDCGAGLDVRPMGPTPALALAAAGAEAVTLLAQAVTQARAQLESVRAAKDAALAEQRALFTDKHTSSVRQLHAKQQALLRKLHADYSAELERRGKEPRAHAAGMDIPRSLSATLSPGFIADHHDRRTPSARRQLATDRVLSLRSGTPPASARAVGSSSVPGIRDSLRSPVATRRPSRPQSSPTTARGYPTPPGRRVETPHSVYRSGSAAQGLQGVQGMAASPTTLGRAPLVFDDI